jgi:hypothetical protein
MHAGENGLREAQFNRTRFISIRGIVTRLRRQIYIAILRRSRGRAIIGATDPAKSGSLLFPSALTGRRARNVPWKI